MMPSCPTDKQIVACLHSSSEADVDVSIAVHIEHCVDCQKRASKFWSEEDVVESIRRIKGSLVGTAGVGLTTLQTRPSEGTVARKHPAWPVQDYEPLLLCGKGACGTVWAVRDRVGVLRALKIIDLEFTSQGAMRNREKAAIEAYCQKVGHHAYLINVFHVGIAADLLYYTMDLADDQNRTSREFSKRYKPLTLKSLMQHRMLETDGWIEVTRRLLRGLARIHRVGLVHRDIKPANVVVVNRQPKLADIGLLTLDRATLSVVGTPLYMPPDHVMDQSADTYAMGKILYEMIVGRMTPDFPRFPGQFQWTSNDWNPVRVEQLIERACKFHANERYANGADLLDELEACRTDLLPLIASGIEAAPASKRSHADRAWNLAFLFVRNTPWICLLVLALFALTKLFEYWRSD